MKFSYLDNAATTYPKPQQVYLAMDKTNRELAVNAGRGSYRLAKEATKLMDDTRRKMLEYVNGSSVSDLIFTPSATISLNMIIGGMDWKKDDVCFVSPFEHNAVMRILYMMQKKYGFEIKQLPLLHDKSIDMEKTEYLFSQQPPAKLFVTHISNVTGYILPVEELAGMAKSYQCKVIVDASQSLGLLDVDLVKMQADYVVFAGHKNMYASFGIGGFFMRKGEKLNPYIAGGTGSDSLNLEMPKSVPVMFEAASPNIVAIAGLHAAIDVINSEKTDYMKHEQELTQYLTDRLGKIKDVILYFPPKEAHIGIVAFNIKGYKAADIGMILDEDYNIAVRTGYHCAPLIHEQLQDKDYAGVVRVSVGRFTEKEDVERFVVAVKELAEGI